jgi:hypothetical protein
MKRISIAFALLALTSALTIPSKAQESPPAFDGNFKPISPNADYMNLADSSVWNYGGSSLGWRKLARYKDVKAVQLGDTINFKYPAEFTFRPFNIVGYHGHYYTSLGVKDLVKDKISKLQPYYLNYQTGKDSVTSGTEARPFKTLSYALGRGARLIYTYPGDIILNDAFGSITTSGLLNQDIFIINKGARKTYILNSIVAPVFTLYAGSMYSASITGVTVTNVVDLKFVNEFGLPLNLDVKGSLSSCQSTPNTYYISANTIYVHLKDDRVPDINVGILKIGTENRISASNSPVYIYNEGLSFIGGGYAYLHSGAFASYLAMNCHYLYSNGNGFNSATNGALTWLQNCIAYRNRNDGFNYAQGTGITTSKNIEVNCQGIENGYKESSTSANNGSSAHNNHTILRVNGSYHGNVGPNVIDVLGSKSLNVGVEAYDSRGFDDSALNPTGGGRNWPDFGDFGTGSTSTAVGSKMWLFGCRSSDSRISFKSPLRYNPDTGADTSVVYLDKSYSRVNAVGNISYGSFRTAPGDNFIFQEPTAFQMNSISGSYIPVVTNTTNVTSSGSAVAYYFKLGSFVYVQGYLAVTPTATTYTQLSLSLPFPSAMGNPDDLIGQGNDVANNKAIACFSDFTNDLGAVGWSASSTSPIGVRFQFMYKLIP